MGYQIGGVSESGVALLISADLDRFSLSLMICSSIGLGCISFANELEPAVHRNHSSASRGRAAFRVRNDIYSWFSGPAGVLCTGDCFRDTKNLETTVSSCEQTHGLIA